MSGDAGMRINLKTIGAVARAIYKASTNDGFHFDRLSPNDKDLYLRMAKAAIEEYMKC